MLALSERAKHATIRTVRLMHHKKWNHVSRLPTLSVQVTEIKERRDI